MVVVVGLFLLYSGLWLFETNLKRTLTQDLQEEAEGLLLAMIRGPEGLQLDSTRVGPRFQQAFSGHYFRIDLPGVAWRSRSLWDAELAWPEDLGLSRELIDGPQGQQLLVFHALYRRNGFPIGISVAQDYTPILKNFQRVRQAGWVVLGIALIILLALQRWVVKRALRPLERSRRQIIQLQHGERQQLDNQAPIELKPLITQINHLLRQTDDTLQRSRHALGNLGHALKTPLAVLESLSRRQELSEHPELQRNLHEAIDQIKQRVFRELAKARLAGDVLPGSHFDCDVELPTLFDTLDMIHPKGLDLRWDTPPDCRLPWDREDMLELLGNLLDNACKWADHRVKLTLAQNADYYDLWIDDDGPGIPEEKRETVIGRGHRLDERSDGHGLGLGIVWDIVNAWQGSAELQDSPLGGLRVHIRLPSNPRYLAPEDDHSSPAQF